MGHADALIKAAQGLTLSEAENAFAKAIAKDNRLDASDVQLILDEKRQVIRKSGLLEYYPVQEGAEADRRGRQPQVLAGPKGSAFGEAARKLRPARAQGASAARRAGLRQEPHRQGGGRAVEPAPAAPRRGAHLLRARRLLGGEPAQGDPGGGERRPGGALDRRDREGPLRHRQLGLHGQRGHRPGLRRPAHLAPGEDGPRVRHRHRQPHRGPAAGAAAQGPLRRDLLRGPALRPRSGGRSCDIHLRKRRRDPARYDLAGAARRSRRTSPGRSSSRRWWRASTMPSPTARSWSRRI